MEDKRNSKGDGGPQRPPSSRADEAAQAVPQQEDLQGEKIGGEEARVGPVRWWAALIFSQGLNAIAILTIFAILVGSISYGISPRRVFLSLAEDQRQALLKDEMVLRHVQMGDAFLDLGRPEEATDEYEQARELDQNNPRVQLSLQKSNLGTRIQHNDFDTAVMYETLTRLQDSSSKKDFAGPALQGEQDLHDAHLSHLLVFEGQVFFHFLPDRALELFEEAQDINPQNSYAIYSAGTVHEALNEPDRALRTYEEALYKDRWNPLYQDSTAYALYLNKRHDEAVWRYEDLLRWDPDFMATYYKLPQVYRAMGRAEEARYHHERLFEMLADKDVSSQQKNVLTLSFPAADLDEGPVFLYEVPEKTYYAYYSAALTFFLLGDREEAEGYVKKADDLRLAPTLEAKVRRAISFETQTLQEGMEDLGTDLDEFNRRFL